jgi:hypothetical protein
MAPGEEKAYPGLVAGITVLLAVCYAAACMTPVVRLDDGIPTSDLDFKNGSPIGLIVLLFGWTGGNNGIPWSANVFLALGLFCLWIGQYRRALALGIIANVLGLMTWWVLRYYPLLIGYYLWQSSLLILLAGSGWVCRRARRVPGAEPSTPQPSFGD